MHWWLCRQIILHRRRTPMLSRGLRGRRWEPPLPSASLLPCVDAVGDFSRSFQRTSRLSGAAVAGIPPLHIPSNVCRRIAQNARCKATSRNNDKNDDARAELLFAFFSLCGILRLRLEVYLSLSLSLIVSFSESQSL